MAKPLWPKCLWTWAVAKEVWYANMMWCVLMKYPVFPSTKKDGVNIMKGYMESGEFSQWEKNPSVQTVALPWWVNFDVDVEHQQRVSHPFGPMPKEMRDDTAFMDRIHALFRAGIFPSWIKPISQNTLDWSKAIFKPNAGQDLEIPVAYLPYCHE